MFDQKNKRIPYCNHHKNHISRIFMFTVMYPIIKLLKYFTNNARAVDSVYVVIQVSDCEGEEADRSDAETEMKQRHGC